jgi:four helix bundle protein
MQDYRQIKAWQRGHVASIEIHRLIRSFTRKGHAHLRSQLARAADSVPSNIVKGRRGASMLDFARFLDVSIKSAGEVEYRLQVARDLNLIEPNTCVRLSNEIVEIRKMTYAYRERVLESARNPTPPPSTRVHRKK